MKEVFFSKSTIVVLVVVILLVIAVFLISGCFRETYAVDYCGEIECYEGAKESYPAGAKVKLCYSFIASDTDYSFYLNGQPLKYDYDSNKGFVIQFTMPKHDVKLECVMNNSMVYEK